MSLTIGILGGVGAIASARFHLNLVEAWAKRKSARTDDDFPSIIHASCSLGLGSTGLVNEEATATRLYTELERLRHCDVIAVVCNSITPWLPKWSRYRFVTPVSACHTGLTNVKSALLVASESTIRDQVYQRAYPHIAWHTIPATPWIEESIKGHVFNPATVGRLSEMLDAPLILGCTELSTHYVGCPNLISPTDEMINLLCDYD